MDNVCHTLVGAALGEAGLKRCTRLGLVTLMIASNLPDLDVLVFLTSTPSVAFRRGWTHGVLAQALLPLILAVIMWSIGRRGARRQSGVNRGGPPVPRLGSLLLLSYVGVLLHVGMDWLNNYGVRLLMPFSGRWFYGDTLFIVDPWLWLVLGAGVWLARRGRGAAPARIAVAVATVYVLAMLVAAREARAFVDRAWTQLHDTPPRALMVGPVAVTPLRRDVIVDAGDHYERGTFTWFPRQVSFDPDTTAKLADDPRVVQARNSPAVRPFLVWSRFPYWTLTPASGGTEVSVGDMRFAGGFRRFARFGASTVIPASGGAAPPATP